MTTQGWNRRIIEVAGFLTGVPRPAAGSTVPRPVPWLAAVRSAAVLVALGTAAIGVWLARTEAALRAADLHSTWGVGANLGGMVSLSLLLYGRGPAQTARHANAALWIGIIGLGAGLGIGRSVVDSGLSLWLQLGVGAGIGVAVVTISAAITHLPVRPRGAYGRTPAGSRQDP